MQSKFEVESDLIFDLGMNNGDDVEYYLKRNYRVIAVEANPVLCEQAADRFRIAIQSGRLSIVNVAISNKCGSVRFYVNLENDHWSSMDLGWAGRDGSAFKEIAVDSISLKQLFQSYGVPYYMKVDVEGADHLVIEQLSRLKHLPYYLSVEDCRFGYEYLAALSAVGYQGFKLLDQSIVPMLADEVTGHCFKRGASGPFGEDIPGAWLSIADMEKHYAREVRDRNLVRQASREHWWDIHCRGVSDR